MPRGSVPLRRELLDAFAVLVLGAVLVTGVTLAAALPFLQGGADLTLLLLFIVLGDLVVVGLFGHRILTTRLMRPVERLVEDVGRIAEGDFQHRIPPLNTAEFDNIREGVNAMADRLVHHQDLLAENVTSLDRTNRELVEARDQVVQAARLASVGTLAAGIAHEVGNPLGAIVAFTDVARGRARREGADTEILDSIRAEAERIDRLVRSLLDFARHKDQEAEPTQVGEVVHRVRELLERQGRLDDVRSVWPELGRELTPVVLESGRLEQVLVNLLLNALDALDGHPDPRIVVTLDEERGAVHRLPARREGDPPGVNYMHRRRVSRDREPGGVDPLFTAHRVVVLCIRDNGPGIPEEALERIFDPFYTTKEPGKGTGLGLYISARFIEGMGGRLQVHEAEGGGAEFVIRLPGKTRAIKEPT
jgi:two-component system, NtrC family, sensor kinase